MSAVRATRPSAIVPSTFICVVTGRCPTRGRVKPSMLKSLLETRGFLAAAPPIVEVGPGRVSGPPAAGRFVIVEEAEAAGRAPALGLALGEEKTRRKNSANDDLGFAGGALAMMFSVQRVSSVAPAGSSPIGFRPP